MKVRKRIITLLALISLITQFRILGVSKLPHIDILKDFQSIEGDL